MDLCSFNRNIYTHFWKPNFIILGRKGWGPNISGCKKYNRRFKFQNSRWEMHGPLNRYTETQYSDQIRLLYIYITLPHFFSFSVHHSCTKNGHPVQRNSSCKLSFHHVIAMDESNKSAEDGTTHVIYASTWKSQFVHFV